MHIKTIGIIGYGHFGAFLVEMAERFLPNAEVRVYSRRQEPDGKLFFDLETVCDSDVVVICGAIHEFEEQLKRVIECAREETIIVDVATVKVHTVNLLKKYAADRAWIATHPMFGPESVKKQGGEMHGLNIVIAEHTLPGEVYEQLTSFLKRLEFNVVEVDADKHDRLLADTLFLTHYVGQTVKEAGFERTSIDTLSFASLMNAVESVIYDEKLFKDVYQFNPHCKETAKRFHDAQEEVFKKLT